jgi:hypothetical protein
VCVEDCHGKSGMRTRAIVESSKVNSDSLVPPAETVRAGAVDILETKPVTSLGNQKVLVVGDMFTRFAVAVEKRTKEQIEWRGYYSSGGSRCSDHRSCSCRTGALTLPERLFGVVPASRASEGGQFRAPLTWKWIRGTV